MAKPGPAGITCRRVDAHRVDIVNPYDVNVTLFANNDVTIEPEALTELASVLALSATLDELGTPFFGDAPARIDRVVLTPDFHKGSGIPVGTVIDARGFVLPRAVGNDVCCGMRLLSTDVTRDELAAVLPDLERRLRAVFFEGKRDIPMSPRQREALLRSGLPGLVDTAADNLGRGAFRDYDVRAQRDDLARAHHGGGFDAEGVFAFDAFIRASGRVDGRDQQIGSIGGGNHFVEIQAVEQLFDGPTAHRWGVGRGNVTVMVHTGSVGLGHMVGGYFDELSRKLFPRGVAHPVSGFFPLPLGGPHAAVARAYLDAMKNAANFAFGNRLFLGLMALRAMSEALGRKVEATLVHDAPHNLIWQDGEGRALHRKGATPALGPDGEPTMFGYTGAPVIIPGSMGASSFLLAGEGSDEALCSACHGAGRALTRGRASHVDDSVYREAMGALRVVGPVDLKAPGITLRRDIVERYHARMKEEAPYAYKPITPVVDSVEGAGVARKVARLWPLVTVKG